MGKKQSMEKEKKDTTGEEMNVIETLKKAEARSLQEAAIAVQEGRERGEEQR